VYDPLSMEAGRLRMQGLDVFDDFRADLAYGFRTLLRSPGFAAVAVIVLGLGIGANLTVFTLANAFLFKNLPFEDSDRILYVSNMLRTRPGAARSVSYPDFLEFREQSTSFAGLAAFANRSVDLSDGKGFPERYRCPLITSNAFSVIGQTAVRGRDFTPDDERPGAPPVLLLSYALWESRYGLDPAIVGTTIRVNDVPAEIVGVMAKGVTFPGASNLWMPLVRTSELQQRDARNLTMFGRLASHATLGSARAELSAIASRLENAYPTTNRDAGILVQNFNDRFNGNETKLVFRSLLGAVAFVMLIACANVANLLLARAVGRSREISIRTTLGASRWRVVRQLLVESLLLAGSAAVIGWLIAAWGVRVFDAALVPAVKPPYIDFTMDAKVLAYLATITAAAGILCGLGPVLQLSRLNISAALKEGSNAAGSSRRTRFLFALLVVTEVSLAVVLLAGAGLMIRSLLNTFRADIGVNATNVLSMNVNLRSTKYPRLEDRVLFYDRLKDRLETVPDIEVAEVASDLPAESPDDFAYDIEGKPASSSGNRPRVSVLTVGSDYFDVVKVNVKAGRPFNQTDGPGAVPVVIVNEMFARESWPGQDPIGKRVRLMRTRSGAPRGSPPLLDPWLTVVGVVPNILQDDESFVLSPVLYFPYHQRPQSGMDIMIRTRVPPATLGHAIRQEVQALDEDLAVPSLRTLEESLWFRNWRHRVFGSMFAIFAAIALVLASVGLYAVIAHSVSRRTREIGVRMALGAVTSDILRLIFKQGGLQVALGLAVGLAAALAVTRVLETILVGVTSADPLTFVSVALVLIAAGALGCAIPARRAIRVDPVVALRND
jgi:putative ABC transport system permease protein